ncbi:hypothetical protein CkaCkLH20_08901 [Colletotrichum karsti]|uniref:SMODS and SLOG-associating 2TM effector domain-containing protein n=1 Tax=Colletotrichum karsti TaxID=1095194 RepID=A0A9P6I2K4_9PEZI|nr:uncharacterized protein CkaCkLH20_08901 [Colletotrichum karsti]KAF9873791.1 hypothetical protein CkaCkLH20_08901 [Colletotrichum karsti]
MSTAASPRPSGETSPLLPRDDPPNPSNLLLFRRAVGINADLHPRDECNLEAGRTAAAGIYASTIAAHRRARIFRIIVSTLLYTCHAAQLVTGAVVTAMGPSAGTHRLGITVLGAANTVIAGVLTFMKSRGIPEKMRRNEVEFRRLQDWIEETDALLMLGVIGDTRDEVGELVAGAYRRWNLANERGEDVRPEEYSREEQENGKKKGLSFKWSRGW